MGAKGVITNFEKYENARRISHEIDESQDPKKLEDIRDKIESFNDSGLIFKKSYKSLSEQVDARLHGRPIRVFFCKDCEHYHAKMNACCRPYEPPVVRYPHDFCSRARRRRR